MSLGPPCIPYYTMSCTTVKAREGIKRTHTEVFDDKLEKEYDKHSDYFRIKKFEEHPQFFLGVAIHAMRYLQRASPSNYDTRAVIKIASFISMLKSMGHFSFLIFDAYEKALEAMVKKVLESK